MIEAPIQIRKEDNQWINTGVFRQEAFRFKKYGYFCSDYWGTPGWLEYWEKHLEYCKKGFEYKGRKITGHHYMYLNFCQIQVVITNEDSRSSKKETTFPDFWDGDYDYYWALEIARNGICSTNSQVNSTEEERLDWNKWNDELADIRKELPDSYSKSENYLKVKKKRDTLSNVILDRLGLGVKPHLDFLNGGHHMIVGKSRRKGYSYKNGAVSANYYNTERKAQIIIGASEKKFLYPKGTMGMTSDYLNFINEHTGWRKSRDYVDKQDHKKASFRKKTNGIDIESGYQSEVFALTFKDNSDAARGKDGILVLLEEAGAFPNLKESYGAIKPALTAGMYITGQIVIFGTGGDMEAGTVDFADMFYNPVAYGIMPFMNVWDDNAEDSTCGFFHPVTINLEGFYDKQGNSDIKGALGYEMARRKLILESSSDSTAYQHHIQEFALKPSEAFLTVSTNDFPVIELRNQLNKIIREKLMLIKGTPVTLARGEKGKILATPDLVNKLNPIMHYKVKGLDLAGCPLIFEFPSNPPKGLFKIGYDPYRQDQSTGTSLAAIYVYKGVRKGDYTRNIIAATYVGRMQTTDSVNRIAEMLAELYNAEIMYENEVPDVKKYFERRKKLHLLAAQPDGVISKNIKNSKVARIYGCHMNEKLKDTGAKYIKQWLLEERDFDENGGVLTNLDYIYDIGLLEELILYNKKGNFDRVMALMQLMFQIEEEDLDKVYGDADENKELRAEMDSVLANLFKKN